MKRKTNNKEKQSTIERSSKPQKSGISGSVKAGPRKTINTKFEVWKDGKKRAVIRENGRLVSHRKIAGTGIKTKKEFSSIFKENNTLYENRRRNKRTKVIETFNFKRPEITLKKDKKGKIESYSDAIERIKKSKIGIKRPGKRHAYIVSGEYINENGHVTPVVASSGASGGITKITKNSREMKTLAWERFFMAVSHLTTSDNSSDAEKGFSNIGRIENIQEGWKSYTTINPRIKALNI